jgi:hypothetical protein
MNADERGENKSMYYLGLDLGQVRDHSAIAIVERNDHAMFGGRAENAPYFVRYAGRVPLGTPYPRVVEWVRRVAEQPEMYGQCRLAADATGVGAPVIEMLRAARLGCDLSPVTITGGEQAHQTGAMWHVPKKDLLSGVQVLLEQGQLRMARGMPETGALVKELLDVQIRLNGRGGVRMGAEGAGKHDDLVIALGLAVWLARPRGRIGYGTVRFPGM